MNVFSGSAFQVVYNTVYLTQVVSGGCTSSSSLISNNFQLRNSVTPGRFKDVIGWTCESWFGGATITARALCCPFNLPSGPQNNHWQCDYVDAVSAGA